MPEKGPTLRAMGYNELGTWVWAWLIGPYRETVAEALRMAATDPSTVLLPPEGPGCEERADAGRVRI